MNRENLKILRILNVAADAVLVVCAMMLSYFFRFVALDGDISMLPRFYFSAALLISPVFLIMYGILGLYESQRVASFIHVLEKLIMTSMIATGILAVFFFVLRSVNVSRWTLIFFLFLSTLFPALKRLAVSRYLQSERLRGLGRKRILLVGSGSDAKRYIKAVNDNRWMGFDVIGSVGAAAVGEELSLLGGFEQLNDVLSVSDADEVVAALSLEEAEHIKDVIDTCEKNGIKLSLIPFYSDYMLSKPAIDDVGGIPLINVRRIPLDNMIHAGVKRLCDISGSILLLILTLPITLMATLGTLLTLGRPLIFRQERVGKGRRSFVMYKFRSMRNAPVESSGWSNYESTRQTRFGTFLRKYAIDELPQLVNVLKGDMSLVGPRPELQKYVDLFKESVPLYMVKHQVRPGITGWAQVNGYRGDTSIDERIRCDIYYIENWSLLLDIKIILLTLVKFVNPSEKYIKE